MPDYPYNLTTLRGTRNIVTFIQEINRLTDSWFGILTLVTAWIVLFISFKARQYATAESFGATAFITSLMALMLRTLGLIPDLMLYINILFAIVSLVVLFTRS